MRNCVDQSPVLIVEDDDAIRETLRVALTMEGYFVVTAANGREALDLLTKIKKPCLILLDLMMPVMNGWEFVMEFQKDMTFASVPIVLVTAYADRLNGILAQGVLRKPVDLNELFTLVRSCCKENCNQRGRSNLS